MRSKDGDLERQRSLQQAQRVVSRDAISLVEELGAAAPRRQTSSTQAGRDTKESEGEKEYSDVEAGASGDESGADDEGKKGYQLTDQTNHLPVRHVVIIFLTLAFAVVLTMLEQTMVAVSLPIIGADVGAGASTSWIASAYMLAQTAAQPVIAAYSNIFGRKIMLLAMIVVFLAGSLGCALSKTFVALIVARVIQGAGGGGIMTLAFIIMADVVSLRDRGKYQPILDASIAMAQGVGPALGGYFAQSSALGWEWTFWISLPLGVPVLIVCIFALPLRKVEGKLGEKMLAVDYVGAVMIIGTCVMFMLPITWGGVSFPWLSPTVLGCLLGSLFALLAFILYEVKVPRFPMIPMGMFKSSMVSSLMFLTLVFGMQFTIQLFYLPQLFQLSFGYSPVVSGSLILPSLFATTISVSLAGQVQARTGYYKWLIVGGMAGSSLGLGLLSMTTESTPLARIVGFSIILGFTQGWSMQTSLVAAQAAVKREQVAAISACRNAIRMLGTTLALAYAATILNNSVRASVGDGTLTEEQFRAVIEDPIQAYDGFGGSLSQSTVDTILRGYTGGFDTIFIVGAALSAAACILTAVFVVEIDLRRGDEAEQKAKAKEWLAARKLKQPAGQEEHA